MWFHTRHTRVKLGWYRHRTTQERSRERSLSTWHNGVNHGFKDVRGLWTPRASYPPTWRGRTTAFNYEGSSTSAGHWLLILLRFNTPYVCSCKFRGPVNL